jgi:hypothetical protein
LALTLWSCPSRGWRDGCGRVPPAICSPGWC